MACCQLKDVSPPHARFYLKKKKNQSISIKKNNKSNFFFSSQGLSGNGGKPGPLSSPRLIACSMTIEMERGENLRLYWSHIGLYFIKHPLALLFASPNLHPWFELLCMSVLVCDNVLVWWVCVWVCIWSLINICPLVRPCLASFLLLFGSLMSGLVVVGQGLRQTARPGSLPKRGGETCDLRPFTKDKTKMADAACFGMCLYYTPIQQK